MCHIDVDFLSILDSGVVYASFFLQSDMPNSALSALDLQHYICLCS